MTFTEIMDWVSRGFEVAGIAVLILGFTVGAVRSFGVWVRGSGEGAYDMVRRYFGRSILLGIEILVAADLIRTVAVEPTVDNVLVLGLIVLIRTFLSFSLEIELEGVVPWRRWSLARALGKPAPAASAAKSDDAV